MWEQIRANQRNAAMLVVLMAGFMFLMGFALGELFSPGGGLFGLGIAFVIWIVLSLVSYFSGDSIFLAMSRAHKIKPSDHRTLYNIVEEMKIASGLPRMPDIYIIDDPAPNAFATGKGPETASVAVTTGLLQILNRDELQGVIAHEMAHVKNRDVLYMMMVGVMMGTIVLLADIGVRHLFWHGGRSRTSSKGGGQAQLIIMAVAVILMILAPIVAQLIYFALSRKKEYLADACAAQFTRYPEGLASALLKISGKPYKLKSATRATASMYIINPMKVSNLSVSDVTSTHPPISERVRILRAMGGGTDYREYDEAFKKVTGRPVGVIPPSSLKATKIEAKKKEREKSVKKEKTATEGPLDSGLGRIREVTNMMWLLQDFLFIACACGTKLKIPPVYGGKKIECPHCNKVHAVPIPERNKKEK